MSLRKTIILSVVFVAVFAACFSGFAKDPVLTTLEGDAVKYSELLAAPKTIFFVWTTWCPYCRQELKRLTEEDRFFDKAAIYFVNVGERATLIKRFVDSQKLHPQFRKKIVLDTQNFIADEFNISAIPVYIFFKDAKAVHRSFYLDQKLLDSIF